MFTKQHYKAIAEIISIASGHVGDDSCYDVLLDCPDSIAPALADYFAKDDPNFDRKKFIESCKYKWGG